MFTKILIANRGEIACRVIRTARAMGIETVAVYSTIDANSLHVRMADSAYCIGEPPAKDSYLNIPAIITAARETGAQAIHPGYGFLSENPLFAQACADEGIVFIGPSINAINAMASKKVAKQLLETSNVPLTPGYHGDNQDDDHLLAQAVRIGFPVLLKAAAGGGGKGMRAVQNRDEFKQALAGARRESMASFADDNMIIEKLVQNPRHVEVQVMADNHGNVVHIFERDCSIQRRHQKIIEEAPAPDLSQSLRQALAEAACEVARSIEYRGAGTVEFLVDGEQHFYFMEMNTRLQVEHPVTEMITGLDLVEWQIKIAANQVLPCSQNEIIEHGHAIECRIYAEDPGQGFIPSIGQLHFLREPSGEGIRIDTGVTVNSIISQYYDPMIAKLIVWGENRQEALRRMQQALRHYAVGGVKSNISFLQSICNHPRFIDARLSTDFLSDETITLPTGNKQHALLMAIAFDYLTLKKQEDSLLCACFGWQMHLDSHWYWRYWLDESLYECKITPVDKEKILIQWDDFNVCIQALMQERLIIDTGLERFSAWTESQDELFTVYFPDSVTHIKRFRWQQNQQAASQNQLTAPMPATVVALLKNTGDSVKKGDALLVLEAMKMEHTIHAPKDGILKEFFYQVGAQVNEGAELLMLEDCTS